LPHLEKLQEREDSICRDAAIAEASLEQEREWLEEHREEISDDECGIIEYLLKLRERWMVIITVDSDAYQTLLLFSGERTRRCAEAGQHQC